MNHEHCGDPIVSVSAAFTRNLDTQKQPYVRRCKVTREGMDLDAGWLGTDGAVGYVIIQNRQKLKPNSPPEEREKHVKRIVVLTEEVMPCSGGWQIRPGAFFVGEPRRGDHWSLRLFAEDEPVDVAITIMPK